VGVAVLVGFMALEGAWQKVFFCKSIAIYKTIKNMKNIKIFFKGVGVTVLCCL